MVKRFKRTIALFILSGILSFPVHANEVLYAQKAYKLEKSVIQNPANNPDIQNYINLLSKRSNKYYFRKDYENSADDLRTILFFLLGKEKTAQYSKYKKRLDKVLTKMCFDTSPENRLEVAKNLYLEGKYFASAYEFVILAEEGYELAVCYEYLGDNSVCLGKSKQALIYYQNSLKLDSSASVNFKLAKLYDAYQEEDQALEKYNTAIALGANEDILCEIVEIFTRKIENNSGNPSYYETLGQAYQALGEYSKTYPLYQRAIQLNPNDIFLKYALGGLLHEMGQYQNAINVYDAILKDNPYESQIRIGKAKCLRASNRTNDAIKEYQIVLAIYPDSKSAQYGIYNILSPRLGMEGAVANFYPLDSEFKPDSNFYLEFARFLDKQGDYKAATQAYELSIDKSKINAPAYLELYDLYVTQNNQAKAYETAQEGHKNLPKDVKIRKIFEEVNKDSTLKKNSLALSYIQNKEYTKAIMLYEQITPKTSAVYSAIANCYKMAKDYDKALAYYNSAIRVDAANSDLYYNMAIVYIDQKDFLKAEENLQKSIGLDKNNIKSVKLLNYVGQKNVADAINAAFSYFEKKDYDKARNTLFVALKKYPKDAQLYYYIGQTYEIQDKFPEALENYRATIKLNRNYDAAYYSMGAIFEKYGRGKEALEAYERFLAGDSTDKEMIKYAQERVIELSKRYY